MGHLFPFPQPPLIVLGTPGPRESRFLSQLLSRSLSPSCYSVSLLFSPRPARPLVSSAVAPPPAARPPEASVLPPGAVCYDVFSRRRGAEVPAAKEGEVQSGFPPPEPGLFGRRKR